MPRGPGGPGDPGSGASERAWGAVRRAAGGQPRPAGEGRGWAGHGLGPATRGAADRPRPGVGFGMGAGCRPTACRGCCAPPAHGPSRCACGPVPGGLPTGLVRPVRVRRLPGPDVRRAFTGGGAQGVASGGPVFGCPLPASVGPVRMRAAGGRRPVVRQLRSAGGGRPGGCSAQGALARLGGAAAAGQQPEERVGPHPEAVRGGVVRQRAEPGGDLGDRQRAQPGGGQFEGQRQAAQRGAQPPARRFAVRSSRGVRLVRWG